MITLLSSASTFDFFGRSSDSYTWIFGSWEECSKTCGSGLKTRTISCANARDFDVVADDYCDSLLKPIGNSTCNTEPCPAQWMARDWGSCLAECEQKGLQVRTVFCSFLRDGNRVVVDDNECEDEKKPITKQACQSDVSCPKWVTGPWSKCNVACGHGYQSREVHCKSALNDTCDVSSKPLMTEPCVEQPCEGLEWVVSEWGSCDGICHGNAHQTRIALCMSKKGYVFKEEYCDGKKKPSLRKSCDFVGSECPAVWHGSQWSDCSTDCGNGIQIRTVMCVVWQGDVFHKADETLCDMDKRLLDKRSCLKSECQGTWVSGPWEPCSVSCGEGFQKRVTFCMSGSAVKSNEICNSRTVPIAQKTCSLKPCNESSTPCHNTYYGCCPDGQSNAQGTGHFGCPVNDDVILESCSFSEWGCCYDGLTPAIGPFKEGCSPLTW